MPVAEANELFRSLSVRTALGVAVAAAAVAMSSVLLASSELCSKPDAAPLARVCAETCARENAALLPTTSEAFNEELPERESDEAPEAGDSER